jgi:hypothetical protein
MGGMFTVLKVRERLDPGSVSSYYEHPSGTLAQLADPDLMRADGIDLKKKA